MTVGLNAISRFQTQRVQPGVNPFIEKSNNEKPVEAQQQDLAVNKVKTLDSKEADKQLQTYSACMSSYAIASINMQNNGSGGASNPVETSGTLG